MSLRISFIGAFALLCLSACDQPAKDNPLFPLAAGKQWTYQIETVYDAPDAKTTSHTLEIRNLGSAQLSDGSQAWVRRSNNGHEYWLVTDNTGIHRVALKSPTKEQAVMDIEARTVLPAGLAVGNTWTNTTVPYFLRRRNEKPAEFRYLNKYKDLPMVFKVVDMDAALQTPAGNFEHCVRVDGSMEIMLWNDDAFAYKPTPIVSREWFCPGVGLAQVERDEPTTAKLFQGGTMRMRLLSYR
jgi:hypothetical protein